MWKWLDFILFNICSTFNRLRYNFWSLTEEFFKLDFKETASELPFRNFKILINYRDRLASLSTPPAARERTEAFPNCAEYPNRCQQFPTFLAPGTGFVEDNFSMDQGIRGRCQDDSSTLHLLCTLFLLLLHQLHLRSSSTRSQRLGIPDLSSKMFSMGAWFILVTPIGLQFCWPCPRKNLLLS